MNEINEDPAARARRYITTLTNAFQKANPKKTNIEVAATDIAKVTEAIQRYLQDAQHYLDQEYCTTALASVAYAEGLLDALTFLHIA